MATFADLGIPLPLFLADVEFVEQAEAARGCVLCGAVGLCLPLDDVLAGCPGCGCQIRIARASRVSRRTGSCQRCATQVGLDRALVAQAANALRLGLPVKLCGCVSCLRAGRWAQSHTTEIGEIAWTDPAGPVELAGPAGPPAGWAELLRTPRYATFQGERWLLCHDLPMIYLGEWGRAEFEAARPGGGYQLFAEIIQGVDPSQFDAAWRYGLTERGGEADLRVYVFRCQRCSTLRSHSDAD